MPLVLLHKANYNINVNVSALHKQCIDAAAKGSLPMPLVPC